jgi:hypothetical protein
MRAGFDTRRKQLTESTLKALDIEQLARDFRAAHLDTEGVTEAAIAALPAGWISRQTAVSLASVNGVRSPVGLNLSFISDGLPMRFGASHYGMSIDHPTLQPYADKLTHASKQFTDLQAEQTQAIGAVESIFRQCRTLKQAVEVWPALLDLMPDYIVATHNAPAEKREKVTPSLNPNLVDVLNGAAVKNKLASAIS